MSGDTPTERFEAPSAAATADDGEKKKSKLLILILSIVGGLLLIAVVVLLTLLFSGRLGSPNAQPVVEVSSSPSVSPSETPSESPSASPSETPSETPSGSPSTAPPPPPPPPPSNDPVITTFNASSSTVACNSTSPQQFPAYLSFTWSTSKVDKVYFGIDTNDASTAPFFDNLPPSGNSASDFPPGYNDFTYSCYAASHKYTLTVIGSNGKKVSKSVTVTNNGDVQ